MIRFSIEGILTVYQKLFPANCIHREKWVVGKEPVIVQKYLKRLSNFESEALYRIAYSLLSGEYVVKTDMRARLDQLQANLIIDFPAQYHNDFEEELTKHVQAVLNYIVFTLKRYKHFVETINNQYSLSDPLLALNAYSYPQKMNRVSSWSDMYDALFYVVEVDHRLSYNQKRIRELILSYSRLENEYKKKDLPTLLQPMVMALKDKCFFLLKKLLIYDKSGIDYMVDFEHRHVGVDDSSPKWLKEQEDCFEFYRSIDTKGLSFGRDLETSAFNGRLLASRYPLLMKYYKDLNKVSISQLDHIIEEFEAESRKQMSYFKPGRKYDIYALNSIKCYLYNARFDYKLSSRNKYTFEELNKDLQVIERNQQETRIVDFYPYLKAAQFLSLKMEIESEGKAEYLDKMNELREKGIDALSICKQHSFYPIQSTYHDSLVMCPGFGPVFIPSSYCRPLQYDKIEDLISELKAQALFHKNSLRLDEERQEIKAIKASIDQSRKQTIEIISAFMAIITFLFGTIDFFSKSMNDTFSQRIYSIVSLGSILVIFVSAVALLTMRHESGIKHYIKQPRFILFVVMLVSFIGVLIYLLTSASL